MNKYNTPIAPPMIVAVDKEWDIDGKVIPVSISIGIAVADSPDFVPAVLLRDADAAM